MYFDPFRLDGFVLNVSRKQRPLLRLMVSITTTFFWYKVLDRFARGVATSRIQDRLSYEVSCTSNHRIASTQSTSNVRN
jgi:hypothetical protein